MSQQHDRRGRDRPGAKQHPGQLQPVAGNLLPHHGEVYLYPEFFSRAQADLLMAGLLTDVPWKQEPIRIFGKEVMQPRLTAWMADPSVKYTYSGVTMSGSGWNPVLLAIRTPVLELTGVQFNGCLLNLYRDGRDSMGWHRDNEKELGPNPVIASVSFGQDRVFQFRDHATKKEKFQVRLTHGSLLVMQGETQHYWEHSIPKSAASPGQRINLTFRRL